MWMMLDYFKSNRTLQEQYADSDIESRKVDGWRDATALIQTMKVITTGMVAPMDERMWCDIFRERIMPSKRLQAHIHECDRMRE